MIQVPLATQYNTFFMFKNTSAADSWTEPGLQLACSVSHKYTTVAVLIKGFTTVYVHCRHFGLLTLGGWGCFNFRSRIFEYMGRTDHNNAYFQAAVLSVNQIQAGGVWEELHKERPIFTNHCTSGKARVWDTTAGHHEYLCQSTTDTKSKHHAVHLLPCVYITALSSSRPKPRKINSTALH